MIKELSEEFKEWKAREAVTHPGISKPTIVLFFLFLLSVLHDAVTATDRAADGEKQFAKKLAEREQNAIREARVSGSTNSREQTEPLNKATTEDLFDAGQVLNEIKELRKKNEFRIDKKIANQKTKESVVFWLLIISGIVALLFLVLGGYVVLKVDMTVGVLTELLALFSGAGTAIFWKLSKKLEISSKALDKERETNLRILQSIQAIFLIKDPVERAKRADKLTEALLNNAENNE